MSEDEVARIIGFRASGGPLFHVSLPIERGLTVLYGLNGSGKTHILDALTSAVSGRRVGLDGRFVDSRLDAALLVQAPEERFARWRTARSDDSWRRWHADSAERCKSDLRSLHRQVEDERSWQVTAPEPRTQGHPRWRLEPAVTPSMGTPAGRVFAAELELWSELRLARSRRDSDLASVARQWAPAEFPEDSGESATPEDGWTVESYYWAEEFFVEPQGAIFFSLLRPEPVADGLPAPVSELLDDYRGLNEQPISGLRLVVENLEPHSSDIRTRAAIQAMESQDWLHEFGRFPTDDGWQSVHGLCEAAADFAGELDDDFTDGGVGGRPPARKMAEYLAIELELRKFVGFLEGLAGALLRRFLLDAPTLSLRISESPFNSYAGSQLEWQSGGRPLDCLSRAQKRWADLAIALALEATLQWPREAPVPSDERVAFQSNTFVVLDEPESALHRTAERHMVRGLEWLSRQGGMHVVVATHSPLLIDSAKAAVFRVHERRVDAMDRQGTYSKVTPLRGGHREELQVLGLEPSDLLSRSRVVLLVEGQHDEIVIEALLSRVIDPSLMRRIEVLAVRGAAKLPVALDSRLLFDFTDATIVPLVDNVRTELLTAVWEQALVLAATEGPQSAGDYLRSALPASAAAENGFVAQFLSRAIAMGVHPRVSPFSLPAVDITDYLPVRAFVSKAKSWVDLRATHRGAIESGETKEKHFKTWVSKRYNTDFSDERIRTACQEVQGCPSDFQALADVCARLCE